jgi:DNA-binding CsgD family transcriptional regulator
VSSHRIAAAILAGRAETIAIVADRRLTVAALSALLLKDPDYHLIAEARGSSEVREALVTHRPALIVEARDDSPGASGGSQLGIRATTLLVNPDDHPDGFASSVRAATDQALQFRSLPHAQLSDRERDILVRIASGRSTKEIARDCAISPKTVGNHVSNIRHKFDLHHRGQLVLFALQQGLTTA